MGNLSDRSLPTKAFVRTVNRLRPDSTGNVAVAAGDLTNVDGGTPSNGDTFIYNSVTNKFEFGTAPGPVTQWWQLATSGATTKLLTYPPSGVPVVSLNGLIQRQTQEWNISGQNLSVLAGMSAEAGDILQVTYIPAAHPDPEDPTSTVTVTNDSLHNAFAGVARTDDDSLVLTYRAASSHIVPDGTIVQKRSTDNGVTWGTATTIVSIPGRDVRDVALAVTPYGLMLTYFEWGGGTDLPFVHVSKSDDGGATWTSLAAVAPFASQNACTAPIVVAGDDALLWPCYGTDDDVTWYTKVLASTDGGVTWTTRANVSIAGGRAEESNIAVLANGSLLMMIRNDTAFGIYSSISSDNGTTWSTPVQKWLDATGRPAVLELFGTLYCMYREVSTQDTKYRTSVDSGATWSVVQDFSPFSNVYVYGQWSDLGGLVPAVAWSEETGNTNSDVYFRRVPF